MATQDYDLARCVQVQSAVFMELLASLSDIKVSQVVVMSNHPILHSSRPPLGCPPIPGPGS